MVSNSGLKLSRVVDCRCFDSVPKGNEGRKYRHRGEFAQIWPIWEEIRLSIDIRGFPAFFAQQKTDSADWQPSPFFIP